MCFVLLHVTIYLYCVAWKVLQSNGSILDAVVEGCKTAEEDRSITSVGWGGRYTNLHTRVMSIFPGVPSK